MTVEARLWQALQEVEDPEIPISVVGMGLIVDLAYDAGVVDLKLTFTAMGCPAMDFIQDDIRDRLLQEPEVDEVRDRDRLGPGVDAQDDPRGRAGEDARAGDRRMIWEVFARKAYEEPLHHVGTVTEEDEDLALVSRPLDLRRAAVDPHDHRAAHRDPGGDQAMKTLVGSLADNKAALGRRYAEWAVSAPTLESAVAAAAMAQDELGHSRSTYPVLKQLGADVGDERFGGDRRLALLDDELPDWNAFIAANLLVDGVLTTFVAVLRRLVAGADGPAREEDPPGGGLAPRARRGVGQAPVPRATSATRSSPACRRPGSTPGAGSGPTTTPSARPRWRPARSRKTPAEQREMMRAWLSELLGGEGVVDRAAGAHLGRLGRRAAPVGAMTCPFCSSPNGRARRPVGRPDHHRPVALQRVQLLLRGRPRRLRRRGARHRASSLVRADQLTLTVT